jgi:DNA-binding response OmpR family regulator
MNNDNPRMLLISCDKHFGAGLALTILQGGVRAECVVSLETAAERIRRMNPDLVVADLATPSFNANTFVGMCEVARQTGARLIVLTARKNPDATHCATLLGADACISKSDPVSHVASRLQFLTRHAADRRRQETAA